MIMEHDIREQLAIWRETEVPDEDGDHLDSDLLYRMAEAGGLVGAPAEAVAHLSLCPRCTHEWARWRRAISSLAESGGGEAGVILSFGMREAAATAKSGREPISLPSACGGFVLSVLPQMDDPDRGMVALEATCPERTNLEGARVSVKDHAGNVILTGRLREGRLARRCEAISSFDLSTWTVVVGEAEI
jgi:hypothetical protein